MEKIRDEKEDKQRKIEGIVLALFCVYDAGAASNITNNNWKNGVIFLMGAGWLLSLILYMRRYRSYHFRAFFTALMMQIGMFFFALQAPDFLSELVNIATITIFLALYGIPDIIIMTTGFVTALVCYHIFMLHEMSRLNMGDMSRNLQMYASIYLVEYIIYYMVKQQMKANEKQRTTIEKLKNAEQSKDDFLANVSHEIRTPINTICGMCEIVLKEDLPKSVRDDLFNIQTAGRNLLSVVSDVLDFSELQSGKIALAEVTYNITSTINDVINMTIAQKKEKNIELLVNCDADFPSGLFGDEQKIRRVIINLVNNAIKFTDDGYVSISFSYRKTDYGINLLVKVKDTGIGMREESIEKLFTSYNQVDTRRNRQEGGIGLGIAISQAIVEELGGFITVKSELDKGSEMKVVIPQKVVDETPIVSLKDPDSINAIVYIDPGQFKQVEVRDEYTASVMYMINQLDVKCQLCHRLKELKRKIEHERFTHVFVSIADYYEDTAYFDELTHQMKVILVLERGEEKKIKNSDILFIYKPFFVLPIVLLVNNEESVQGVDGKNYFHGGFIAPDVHILVVDDNAMNLQVVEGLLQAYQIKVTKAMSGREALEKIETKDYDFVFMDHMMPEMDGIETLHHVRKKNGSYFKTVPIIALTANAIAGMREAFLKEGFQDFIAKPIEISVLERVLKRNIPEKKILHLNGSLNKKIEKKAKIEDTFTLGDLEVQKGITYCGGIENYLEILKMHCRDGEANRENIEKFYQKKDWGNYTILVHALKSSMRSIGANRLSDLAKELEQAGKKENETFIRAHHGKMMEEYERVLDLLKQDERIAGALPKKEEATKEVTGAELSDAEYDRLMEELDEAACALDGEEMSVIIEKMQQYSYHGYSLKEKLEPVKKKIEMYDFMSAAEVVRKLGTKEKGVV